MLKRLMGNGDGRNVCGGEWVVSKFATKFEAMSTKPVLYYFDLPARGEAIRLAFAIGHIEFEDFRVSHEEWLTKYKPLTPAGQLPVLELGDMKYCESQAILMYAAKRAGLVPEEPEHLLSMCQAINGLERIWSINGLLYRAKPEETDQVQTLCLGSVSMAEFIFAIVKLDLIIRFHSGP